MSSYEAIKETSETESYASESEDEDSKTKDHTPSDSGSDSDESNKTPKDQTPNDSGSDSEESSSEEVIKETKKKEDCHWNVKFQTVFDKVKKMPTFKNLRYEERERMWRELAQVAMDFTYAAKTYGRIIISEVFLPGKERTIKPLNVGGEAGGEKYIVESILFKFAIDDKGIFGGNEMATHKLAGQDLLCLSIYSDLTLLLHNKDAKKVPDFSFPLCCLIDYRGFRLIAVSLVPIGSNDSTLKYGSDDGGRTIKNEDRKGEEIMRICAEVLNLGEHYTVENKFDEISAKSLWCCADMELHKGRDGRYYLVDYARGMPPQDIAIQTDVSMRHLLLKLRPEWCQLQDKPLNPDVFSQFIRFRKKPSDFEATEEENKLMIRVNNQRIEHEKYVREVTKTLIEKQIPFVAEKLTHVMVNLNQEEKEEYLEHWIPVFVHFYGVNLRFLGKIRTSIIPDTQDKKTLKFYLLIEMVARVLKHEINKHLRVEMRNLKFTGEQPYIAKVIKIFNLVFGAGEETVEYWNSDIKNFLKNQFPDSCSDLRFNSDLKDIIASFTPETGKEVDGERGNGICILFNKLSEYLGLQWRGSVQSEFRNKPSLYTVNRPFDTVDLSQLVERVKRIQIIAHSQGVVLRMQGFENSHRPKYAQILLKESLLYFRQTLSAVPRNQRTLRNTADVLDQLGNRPGLADLFYQMALECSSTDPISLYKYAYFLHQNKRYEDADLYYQKSNEAQMTSGNLLAYANFLVEFDKIEKAHEIMKQAIKLFPHNSLVHHNYARFLHATLKSEYDTAEKHYQQALALEPKKLSLIKDFADFNSDIRNNQTLATELMEKYANTSKETNSSGVKVSFRLAGIDRTLSNSVQVGKSNSGKLSTTVKSNRGLNINTKSS